MMNFKTAAVAEDTVVCQVFVSVPQRKAILPTSE